MKYECDPFMDKPWDTLYDVCDLWAVSDDIADDLSLIHISEPTRPY